MTHTHITIKGRLPGYNELTIGHWRTCHKVKSEAMELVMWEFKLQKVKPIGHAQIKITCYEPNKKRDPSNVRAGAEKVIDIIPVSYYNNNRTVIILKKWDIESIEILKLCYKENRPLKEISNLLERPTGAIRTKAWRLGLGNAHYWTEEEITYLKDNYKSYNLQEVALHIGRNKVNVCKKAKELGIEINHRKSENPIGRIPWKIKYADLKKTPEELFEIRSKKTKKSQAEHGHPRGMLGKKHSQEFKDKMSIRVINEWKNPYSALRSEELSQKKSDRMSQAQTSGKLRQSYSRGHQGKREDLGGLYVRSTWEANYARYLNFLKDKGEIFKWEYEPDTFWFNEIKRGVRSYLPDFKIWEKEDSVPYYVEVKGWMDDKSKTKLNRMEKYYPNIKIILFQNEDYKELKKWARLISGWED